MKKKRVLILCTGNSCRSQMAEGFLRSFDDKLEVHSAGTIPAAQIHPKAVLVMLEMGIDLRNNYPKNIELFLNQSFDYVISVCDHARETCPVFLGKVAHRMHIGFEDPAGASGSDTDVLTVFRKVRDEIKSAFYDFYLQRIKGG